MLLSEKPIGSKRTNSARTPDLMQQSLQIQASLKERKENKPRVNWNVDMLDSVTLQQAKSSQNNKWMSINQQVLNELLEYEQQCMGFFDEKTTPNQTEELNASNILSRSTNLKGLEQSSKNRVLTGPGEEANNSKGQFFLDNLREKINQTVEMEFREKDKDESGIGGGLGASEIII